MFDVISEISLSAGTDGKQKSLKLKGGAQGGGVIGSHATFASALEASRNRSSSAPALP